MHVFRSENLVFILKVLQISRKLFPIKREGLLTLFRNKVLKFRYEIRYLFYSNF
jgi:uncharacterized membrane protein